MKKQKVFSVLQLLVGVTVILFIAGIAAPSLLRSYAATNPALAEGSLHTINIAGLTFSYKLQNIGFAVLGALFGAATALAIASPATAFKSAIAKARFSQMGRILKQVYSM